MVIKILNQNSAGCMDYSANYYCQSCYFRVNISLNNLDYDNTKRPSPCNSLNVKILLDGSFKSHMNYIVIIIEH